MSGKGFQAEANGKNGNGKASLEAVIEPLAQTSRQANPQNGGSTFASAEGQTVEADALNRIRDILFGQQVRESESHFAALELRLVQETGTLRAEFNQQLMALEVKVTQQIAALSEQIAAEQSTRQTAITELQSALKTEIQALHAALDEQIETVLQKLAQEQQDRSSGTQAQKVQLSKLFAELAQNIEVS